MKCVIFSIVAFLCFSSITNAQDQQEVRNFHLQGGTVNGDFHAALGFEKLIGKDYTHGIFFALNYQRLTRTDSFAQMLLKEQNTFLSAGYRKYFPVSDRVSPYAGLSVLAGYQYIGYSQNGIYEHIPTRDFLYGAGAHTGIEYRLNPFSFFLEGAYLFEFNHSWILSIGIKYYF